MELKSATTLISDKIVTWYETTIENLPNMIVAIVVIIVFIILAKIIRKISNSFVKKKYINNTIGQLISTTIYLVIIITGIFVALEVLNLNKTVTSILAGAGVLGIALGFAFQEIASNFVSGLFIAIRQPYKIGDVVEVDDMYGEVTNINLRTTSLVTFQGIEIFVPNKYMFTKPLKNYTTTPLRRLDIKLGVSYDDDLEKVEKITLDTLESLPGRIKDKPIDFFYSDFGDSSINFEVKIWISYPDDNNYLKTRHQSIISIKQAFAKNNITIPYPTKTVLQKNME